MQQQEVISNVTLNGNPLRVNKTESRAVSAHIKVKKILMNNSICFGNCKRCKFNGTEMCPE